VLVAARAAPAWFAAMRHPYQGVLAVGPPAPDGSHGSAAALGAFARLSAVDRSVRADPDFPLRPDCCASRVAARVHTSDLDLVHRAAPRCLWQLAIVRVHLAEARGERAVLDAAALLRRLADWRLPHLAKVWLFNVDIPSAASLLQVLHGPPAAGAGFHLTLHGCLLPAWSAAGAT